MFILILLLLRHRRRDVFIYKSRSTVLENSSGQYYYERGEMSGAAGNEFPGDLVRRGKRIQHNIGAIIV